MRTMTLKVGTLGWWHAVHIVLSIATGGAWLLVYAIHAIVAAATRPTITVQVPEGGRVQYHRGCPHVLGPGEHLDTGPWWKHALVLAAILIPLAAAVGVIIMSALA